MNQVGPLSEAQEQVAESATAEVRGLIEVLHEADQRLEALTGGEVDSVVSRDGEPFLLHRAQESLRHSEAAKQAAILNALPARIALLDARGLVISVNDAWRRYSGATSQLSRESGVGSDYPAFCDRQGRNELFDLRGAAKGVRAVLSGETRSFSLEYPSESPTQQRWFLLTVTALHDEIPNGAVVMHLDITDERKTQENLRISDARFRQMAASIRDVFFLQNINGSQVYYVSPAYEEIWDRSCESVLSDASSWLDYIHPDDLEAVTASFIEGRFSVIDCEYRMIRPDGEIRWIHVRAFPVLDDAGQPYRTAGVAADVTPRKEANDKIKRLNRVYAMLSGINSLIVRVRDRDELFREACRIAVEVGAFRMAWIGVIDPESQEGKVVASCGAEQGYIDKIRLTAKEGTPDSDRPSCRVLRRRQPIVCNEIAADSSVADLCRDLAGSGCRSVGCFPLTVAGHPSGVLALYSDQPGVFDDGETRLLVELAGDISFGLDHLEKAERLNYVALYDPLTGLANRRLFLDRVMQYARSAIIAGHKLALCIYDLERFKNINDTFGQLAGDALLQQVADWLAGNHGSTGLLARVGADKFAVVMPAVKNEEEVAHLLRKSMEAFMNHPFHLNDSIFRISAKVGVAVFPDDGDQAEALFANAEAALKKARASGDRCLFYSQKMTETVASRLTLEFRLRLALDNDEFVLHYQPKINLLSGALTGAEALIRWNDPRSGLVPPAEFIPVMEETGLIFEVGRWALRKAIEDYLRWRREGLIVVPIAVNVSPMQLRNESFVADIEAAVGVDPDAAAGLELEITESVIMHDVKATIKSLQAVRTMGVSIAIDDFGTGFSSLNYLSKLPVDTLKIDRSFVTDMTVGPQGLALVSTIINLAHSLKLKVVAEGVETEEQSRLLRLLACDEMQGFLFSRPVPADVFERTYLQIA